jgi:ribosomal-protein-alanine N-acetyltransferase
MLKGKNISLRLVRETDLSELYDKWHDAEARGLYYPLALVPESIFKTEFAKNGFYTDTSQRLLIVDAKDNMLGLIHCFKPSLHADNLELSYFLFDAKYRRKGYTSEAVMLLVDYLFCTQRMNRIQICVPDGNQASMGTAEKAGFIHEGIAREAFLLNGKDIDLHIYALLRREWPGNKLSKK